MTQAEIDFAPLARNTDPATSHAAAASARELASEHHKAILTALEQHGPAGKDRIAVLTRLTGTQVARRTCELLKVGKIALTGRCVASNAGRAEREWALPAPCYFATAGAADRKALEAKGQV